MPETKRETDAAEERPVKSQKLEENELFVPQSLDDINDHCVLEIFKCLSVEDLNSVACFISKRFNELRSHDSLDQTRTGTIVCTENTTLESVRRAFVEQQWNQVFTGNRTRLKVVGLDRMPDIDAHVSNVVLLPNVSSLNISCDQHATNRGACSVNNIMLFLLMLPHVEEFDMNYMILPPLMNILAEIIPKNHRLRRINLSGSTNQVYVSGASFFVMKTLTELHLDNSVLMGSPGYLYRAGPLLIPTANVFHHIRYDYLFDRCNNLERLSIKNAVISYAHEPSESISQDMLIKMVRQHRTLRWLRSDLTQENIAVLQQERPDITFVTE